MININRGMDATSFIQGGISMKIMHNMQAMNSNRMLSINTSAQAKSTEKLSSGYRINRAADDAAGLTISEKMRSQIRGLTQAVANAQDGISCVQTAEGALGEVEDMLQRMNELAVKSANGTNTSADREAIQKEVTALQEEISRVAESTEFNTQKLLNGDFSGNKAKVLQVGAENDEDQTIKIEIAAMDAQTLGVDSSKVDVSSKDGAKSAIDAIKDAIDAVSAQRSGLGAVQNRLEHTIKNLDNVVENTTAAESQIRDTDMAAQMVEYTKNNILMQAGQAMLAQANQSTQGVLTLLS